MEQRFDLNDWRSTPANAPDAGKAGRRMWDWQALAARLAAGHALRLVWVDQAPGGAAGLDAGAASFDAGAARHLAGFDVPQAQAYLSVNPVNSGDRKSMSGTNSSVAGTLSPGDRG